MISVLSKALAALQDRTVVFFRIWLGFSGRILLVFRGSLFFLTQICEAPAAPGNLIDERARMSGKRPESTTKARP